MDFFKVFTNKFERAHSKFQAGWEPRVPSLQGRGEPGVPSLQGGGGPGGVSQENNGDQVEPGRSAD